MGPTHRLTAEDLHVERLAAADAAHDGSRNEKSPSYITADSETESAIRDQLPPEAFDCEWSLLEHR